MNVIKNIVAFILPVVLFISYYRFLNFMEVTYSALFVFCALAGSLFLFPISGESASVKIVKYLGYMIFEIGVMYSLTVSYGLLLSWPALAFWYAWFF